MQTKLKEIKNNEEGAALIFVMMILLVFVAIGGAVGTVTVGSHRLSDNNKNYNSAYYIAEAGANMAYAEIETYVSTAYKNSEAKGFFFDKMSSPLGAGNNLDYKEYKDFGEHSGNNPVASVTIIPGSENGNTKEFTISSVGKVAGKTRTVEKKINITWIKSNSNNIPKLNLDSALTINSSLLINDATTVKGDITYPSNLSLVINNIFKHFDGSKKPIPPEEFKWAEKGLALQNWINPIVQNELSKYNFINDINYKGPYDKKYTNNVNVVANKQQIIFNEGVDFTGNIVSNGGNIVINVGAKINGNIISNGGDITFNDGVNITGNIISNGGEIMINKIAIINGSIITTGNSKKITVNDGATIRGNIIANGGDISLSKNMDVIGGILNPRGHMTINDGGKFEGPIYVDKLTANKNKTFIHSSDYLIFFPFNNNQNAGDSTAPSLDELIFSLPSLEN